MRRMALPLRQAVSCVYVGLCDSPLVTSPPEGVRSIVMSMFVYLSVCLSVCLSSQRDRSQNSKTTKPNFTKLSMYVAYWPRLSASLAALLYVIY